MLRTLSEADIVVLAHGFTGTLSREEYATIFPTRTIESLTCGRPLLAHAPADCYLTRFLREQDCALVVDVPEIPALLAAIERLRNDDALRARLVRNALQAAEKFRASRVAATLRTRIHASHP
jgi:glycosyltransferase involved in cell wall biosynthesis